MKNMHEASVYCFTKHINYFSYKILVNTFDMIIKVDNLLHTVQGFLFQLVSEFFGSNKKYL